MRPRQLLCGRSFFPHALFEFSFAPDRQAPDDLALKTVPAQDFRAGPGVVPSIQFAHQRGPAKGSVADVVGQQDVGIVFVLVQGHRNALLQGPLKLLHVLQSPSQRLDGRGAIPGLDATGRTKTKGPLVTGQWLDCNIGVALMRNEPDQCRCT